MDNRCRRCFAVLTLGTLGMNWVDVQKNFQVGQIVNAQIDQIDPAGIFSIVESSVKGYTKRSESQLSRKTVDLQKTFSVGQNIDAKIIGFNAKHKMMELSFKEALNDPWPDYVKNIRIGDFIEGQVVLLTESKAIVEVLPGVAGVIHKNDAWIVTDNIDQIFMVDDFVKLQVIGVDNEQKLFILSAKGLFQDEREDSDTQATFRIEEKLTDALQIYRWEQTRQVRCKYTISPIFHKRFQNIYVIDLDEDYVQPLRNMLSVHDLNCSYLRPDQVENTIHIGSTIAFVACKKYDDRFLPALFADKFPDMPQLVYGTVEQFEVHKDLLDELPEHVSYIKIPHSAQDVLKTLNIIADGEQVNALKYSLTHAPEVEHTLPYVDQKAGTKELLKEIQSATHASFVVVFQVNLNSMETDVYAAIGRTIELSAFDRGHLQFSPISDVIVDGDFVSQDHGGYHFKYMNPVGHFEALVGIRVNFTDQYGYGLFLFSTEEYAFSTLDKKLFTFSEIAIRAQIEREKLIEQTTREQKFVLSGKLSSNFMHEIKNQIQAMDFWLDVLRTDSISLNSGQIKSNDKRFLARFDQAITGALSSQQQTRHIEDLFLNLLRKGDKRALHLEKCLDDFVNTISPVAKKKKIKLAYTCQHALELKVNVSSFNQILLNLILNCIDFIPLVRATTGKIDIRAYKEKNEILPVKIEISDNGPGINERNRERVFELLYTTKVNGSGLGLSISRRLAEEMGGRLFVKATERLNGTTFLLELPLE